MPFDDRQFPAPESALARRNRRLVALWLFTLCFMTLVMVVLGGVTRLTGSGLSIMEWAPVSGVIPPLNEADWRHLFHLYQQIPQYALVNEGFGLAGFKHIFWLEWTHRLWGRLLGVMFLVPLILLWWQGAIGRALLPRLILLFLLGGLQGAVGWFMVASGFFPDSIAVSPSRLVIHLSLALVLYAAMFWTGLSVLTPRPQAAMPAAPRRLAQATLALLALTIPAGGFVAGTHAGLVYNTFPRMEGHWVPQDYAALTPFWHNLTENVAAVQFDHRLLATLTALLAMATVSAGLALVPAGRARWALLALGATVVLQYTLGVATLLRVVPIALAAAHQANAVLLLTATLATVHALRRAR